MPRPIFLALSLLLFSSTAFGQAAPNDSQTLQSLLTEVRQLRQDVQTAALAARRGQILIYRLHAQQAVVDHLSERLEGTKTELAQFERQRESWTARIKKMEERKEKGNPEERKELEDIIAAEKEQTETRAVEEQDLKAKQVGLEEELRTEQAKLGRLQDELDRLDKALENPNR